MQLKIVYPIVGPLDCFQFSVLERPYEQIYWLQQIILY